MNGREATAVWIDARHAVLVRWPEAEGGPARIESNVPPHHRSSGPLNEKGGARHGGGGASGVRERHRLEHLRLFVDEVRAALPAGDLLLVGDGAVVDRLAAVIHAEDARLMRARRVAVEHRARLTDGQLVERLREFAGSPPRRQRPRPIPRLRPRHALP